LAIDTVLFDADGVLQHPSVRWREAFQPILGTSEKARLEPFLHDMLAAETASLCTPSGFEGALAAVLCKWHCPERLTDALHALNAIDVDEDVMHVIRSLRRAGVNCHLASNQQAHRARHMSEVLNYSSLFGREFYSCFLGVAKPEVEFFERVLRMLSLRGNTVLFLDDREENVTAARQAGLAAAVYAGTDGAPTLKRVLAEHGLRVA